MRCKYRENDNCKKDGRPCIFSEKCFEPESVTTKEHTNYVEVVYCRECKHWWKANELCAHPKCREGMVCVTEAPADHYCGYGERKADEEE